MLFVTIQQSKSSNYIDFTKQLEKRSIQGTRTMRHTTTFYAAFVPYLLLRLLSVWQIWMTTLLLGYTLNPTHLVTKVSIACVMTLYSARDVQASFSLVRPGWSWHPWLLALDKTHRFHAGVCINSIVHIPISSSLSSRIYKLESLRVGEGVRLPHTTTLMARLFQIGPSIKSLIDSFETNFTHSLTIPDL